MKTIARFDVLAHSVRLVFQLFRDDIKYLLSMENLWKKRNPPIALDLSCLPDTGIATKLRVATYSFN